MEIIMALVYTCRFVKVKACKIETVLDYLLYLVWLPGRRERAIAFIKQQLSANNWIAV